MKRLDEGQLAEIEDLYDGSYGSVRELAKLFNVQERVILIHTNHKGYRDWNRNWQKKKRPEPRYKEIQKRAYKKWYAKPENKEKHRLYVKLYKIKQRLKLKTPAKIQKKEKILKTLKNDIDKNIKLEPKEIKNEYYCKNCKSNFKSKLPFGDAICIKCGSEKIFEKK